MLTRILPKRFMNERLIGRFLIGSMGLGFLALLIAGTAALWATARNQEHTLWVNHTYEVELSITRARALIEQTETARRGQMLMPGQPQFAATYDKAMGELEQVQQYLDQLTRDNPVQQQRLAAITQMLATLRSAGERTNDLVAAGRVDEAIALFRRATAAQHMARLRTVFESMAREEQALLDRRDDEQRRNVYTFYYLLAAGGVLLVLVAGISLLTILRYTRDLAGSRNSLKDLNETLEDAVKERTADLTRANEEIQRFAYIVSHDLRSPLVNVMGFTAELDAAGRSLSALVERAEQVAPEIVTEDARRAAREDLPEAIGFIRSSTQKMDRLINAILKLSREGRRVISPERLDMTALMTGIRDTLQHRLVDEGTELVIEPMPAITSDRMAIEQIFSNLVENAVKYLQPGRPGRIAVRGRREGARALFEVEDNGRGIDPRDHERVFDLFRRSGQQDQPGEGIGLAHVRALAYRLGGFIDVRSELGKGATFRLSLPVNFAELQQDERR